MHQPTSTSRYCAGPALDGAPGAKNFAAMLSHVKRGAGPALVLIPGFEGAKEFWRPQIEALSARYRVIACDLPVLRPSIERCMADYARPVLDLMSALDVPSGVVMGASLGGLVALEVALREPERVDGLVLVSTIDRLTFSPFGLNLYTAATAAAVMALVPQLPRGIARELLRWAGGHGGFFMDSAPNRNELVDYALRYGVAAGAGALADRLIAAVKARYSRRMRKLDVPMLLVRGSEDRLVGAAAFDTFCARLPGAETVTLLGAGHSCTLSAAEAANRVILGWLDQNFAS